MEKALRADGVYSGPEPRVCPDAGGRVIALADFGLPAEATYRSRIDGRLRDAIVIELPLQVLVNRAALLLAVVSVGRSASRLRLTRPLQVGEHCQHTTVVVGRGQEF